MTRRRALGILGGGLAALAVNPLGSEAKVVAETMDKIPKSHFWNMAARTFEFALENDPELQQAMQGVTCYVTGDGPNYGTHRIHSMYTQPRRVETVERNCADGTITAGMNVVWPIEHPRDAPPEKQTPIWQIKHIGAVCGRARAACDSVAGGGATFIPVVGASCASVLRTAQDEGLSNTEVCVKHNLYARAAPHATTVLGVEHQQSEQNLQRYVAEVRASTNQARGVRPDIDVMPGITTASPVAQPTNYPTPQQMARAMLEVAAFTNGGWLNVPPRRQPPYEKDYKMAHQALRYCYGLA